MTKEIKAVLPLKNTDGEIAKNRKEKNFYKQISIVDRNLKEIIVARFYSTQSTTYCCLWVRKSGLYLSGGGKTSGWGYHRGSEALQNAINDAGIILNKNIGGRGEIAMENALKAIALKLGSKKNLIINAAA